MGGERREHALLEAELRAALSDKEYRQVIRQLEGAVAAVDLLADRAPHVVERFFLTVDRRQHRVDPMLPADAKAALAELIAELRAAREPEPTPDNWRCEARIVKGAMAQ